MTHTAGPWEPVMIDDPRGQPVPFYRGLICTVEYGSRYLSVVASDGRTVEPEEWADNCRLLARAPELLAKIAEARAALDELASFLRDALAVISSQNLTPEQTAEGSIIDRVLRNGHSFNARGARDALAKLDTTEQSARLEGSPT